MELSDSEYFMGSQTLREIEFQENAVLNRPETEVIEGSQDLIEETPKNSSFKHKSITDRFRMASQRQIIKKKFEKSKSDTTIQDPVGNKRKSTDSSLTLSRMIHKELENIDFNEWENSVEKYISPANKSTKQPFRQQIEVSKLAIVDEEDTPERDYNNIDNVTFIEPRRADQKNFQEASQYIDEQINLKNITYEEEYPIENSKGNFSHLSVSRVNQSLRLDATKDLTLITSWNLPQSVVNEYRRKGVERIFDWQSECLQNPKVLFEGANLVYSAPTSAGKTLVSEILMVKNVLERRKKALFILPFVAIVREKINYLLELLTSSGVKVDGYYGGYYPARGFDSLDIIVGTYEKANSIINRMLEENKLEDLGMIVIDEIHSISDSDRGYILELLLTKVLFMCNKFNYQIQLVGMSATLPNVDLLCRWLNAEFYSTNFRPVELREMIKIDRNIYNRDLKFIRTIENNWSEYLPNKDVDDIFELTMETIGENLQLIIFCPTKLQCESLCKTIAEGVLKAYKKIPEKIESIFNLDRIKSLLCHGESLSSGFDDHLKKCLNCGCAFHHSGLTTDERDLVEMGFKSGIIKLLVATTTLSAGVNLPSRRVIIRTPVFYGNEIIDPIKYQQMIGRAGRKGQDTLGESILVCNKTNEKFGKDVLAASLKPIKSCLDSNEFVHLKRAILEIVASKMACTREDLESFVNYTLLGQGVEISFEYLKQTPCEDFKAIIEARKENAQNKVNNLYKKTQKENDPIKSSMNFLLEYGFIRLHEDDDTNDIIFVPNKLGLACLASSLAPREGFLLFEELIKASKNFVLECDLHAIYLCTPYSVCYNQLRDMDWAHYADIHHKLPDMMKRVGDMVGVSESFLMKGLLGRINGEKDFHQIFIHKRFYIALALQDLVNEVPIAEVAVKFKISRADLQSLQQSASAFAGTITNFCEALEWNLMVLIIKQFRERLFFGVHPDLIDLMKIPSMTSTKIARALYKAKIRNLNDLATAKKVHVEDILISLTNTNGLFMSGMSLEIPVYEVAKMLINDAQNYLQVELGVKGVKWSETQNIPVNFEKVEESKILNTSKVNTTTNSSFKTPLNSSAVLQDSGSKKVLKRKISSEATFVDSPRIFDTPKKIKTVENDYKKKLRSSGSKTDIQALPGQPEKISYSYKNDSDTENHKVEFSYENVSLFNNHGISLADDDLMPFKTTSGIENFLEIIGIKTETDLKKMWSKIVKQSEVSVSIGVSVIQSRASTIGGNILKAQKSTEKFIFKDKFYIECLSFCCEGNKIYYLDVQQGNWFHLLKRIFAKSDVSFSMFECKENLKVLLDTGICCSFDAIKTKDPKIAAWFIDPDMSFKWITIVEKFATKHLELFNLIPQHHRSTSSIGLDYRYSVSPKDRTAIEAFLVNELLKAQKMDETTLSTQLSQKSQTVGHLKVFTKLEMPIQKILAKMEIVGFPVDNKKLHEMIEKSIILKRQLEDYIYRLNGGRFDITNKGIVAKVVGIHKENGKKFSTAKDVLAKIDSPIAGCISTFRTLSTTIANLQPMTKIVHNGRVHGSSFSLTQTGRISMGEPNLQNVTKDFVVEYKDMKGKTIEENVSFRSAFRCRPGRVLLSADFCQLELRILTHLCKDPKLTATIEKPNDDIFKLIAAEWNKIKLKEVTDLQRNQTKQLCYGVIYGMGTKALAAKMDVSENEAKKIVEKFHTTYKRIQDYTLKVVEKARKEGYIETITFRRRYLPLINSQNRIESSKAERQALNSTIQGSASDLVKNAILVMEKNLRKKNFDADECTLVLHLHDELFYEVKESKWKEAMNIITESMEKCVKLNVPLKVKVKMGTNWGEMQEVK